MFKSIIFKLYNLKTHLKEDNYINYIIIIILILLYNYINLRICIIITVCSVYTVPGLFAIVFYFVTINDKMNLCYFIGVFPIQTPTPPPQKPICKKCCILTNCLSKK